MSDKLWKATERMIAQILGGERVPITGRQRGDVPDIKHSWLSLEVKHREAIPGWIIEGMEQAEAASKNGMLPALVIHQKGDRHTSDLICVRMGDFVEWFGGFDATAK
jgi:hypothetical protein